jgi:hypothetical protein
VTEPRLCITLDVDWAPEGALDVVLGKIRAAGVKCTFFATHASPLLQAAHGADIEVGLHPNFNDCNGDFDTPLRTLKDAYPEARGARSHSLFVSSHILQLYRKYGLQYESNNFMPMHQHLHPVLRFPQFVSIPFYWSDDRLEVYDFFDFDMLQLDAPGLKVLNFHPIHVFMNTTSEAHYLSYKAHYQDVARRGARARAAARPPHLDDARAQRRAPRQLMTRDLRIDRILRGLIRDLAIDLSGLTVYTEAASGAYLHTPILAAVAGAEHVFALTRDSRFGKKEDVEAATYAAADAWGVRDRITVRFSKEPGDIGRSDMFTNSGFVRPIDAAMVAHMKPTAVVPLMWETWEFRSTDLDLDACRANGILVMGTHEGDPPLSMYEYGGFFAMKLLFDLGLEGHKTRVLLLGGGAGLGIVIARQFRAIGIEVEWFAREEGARPFEDVTAHFRDEGDRYDLILVAEHAVPIQLLGREGLLTYDDITRVNPGVRIGIISGNVDAEGLAQSGLAYWPKVAQPFGTMWYQAYELGPRPTLELYAGGLKVGEAMARARLRGLSLEDARSYAIANSPAMDF